MKLIDVGEFKRFQVYTPMLFLMWFNGQLGSRTCHGRRDHYFGHYEIPSWPFFAFLVHQLTFVYFTLRFVLNACLKTEYVWLSCYEFQGALVLFMFNNDVHLSGKFNQFFTILSKIEESMEEQEMKTMKKLVRGSSVFVFLVVIFRTISDTGALILSTKEQQDFANFYLFGLTVEDYPKTLFLLAFIVDFVFRLSVEVASISRIFTYPIMLYHLRLKFVALRRDIRRRMKDKSSLTVFCIVEYRRRVGCIGEIGDLMENTFTVTVSFCCAIFLTMSCTLLMQFLQELSTGFEFGYTMNNLVLQLFSLLFIATMITVSVLNADDRAIFSTFIARRLVDSHPYTDIEFTLQAEMLDAQIKSTRCLMTVWHFFRVDRSAIMRVYSALLTYLMVLLQANANFMKLVRGVRNDGGNV